MILISPAWLWLLAAAAVPVAVHLLNRKQGKPVLLGTFRFLPEQTFAKARKFELHETFLLIVRIAMICILVLLLAGVMIPAEQEGVQTVMITETEESENPEKTDTGVVEIRVSPQEVDETGWWNLVKQADIDYQPDAIHVAGELTQARFTAGRPAMRAEVMWEHREETEGEIISRVWQSPEGVYSAWFQQRDSTGVRHHIREIPAPEILGDSLAAAGTDTVAYAGILRAVINTDAPEPAAAGLEFATRYWNMDSGSNDEQEQPGELMKISAGEKETVLESIIKPDGTTDFTGANSQAIMEMNITGLDTTAGEGQIILRSGKYRVPVMWRSGDGNFRVNGEIEESMEAWFFAGAGHRVIRESLGTVPALSPSMPEEQLRTERTSQGRAAEIVAGKPAGGRLFLCLLALWALERLLAPRRGM